MKKIKKIAFSLLLLITAVALVACGNNEESDDKANQDKNNETASLYDQIMEEGVLTVGTEGTYPPYTFHDESGDLTGYDVEVVREIAKRMGVEVKFEETQWDAMFSGLNAKRFNLIANQVGINDERKENYDFSIPYTYTSAVVVVPTDNTDITSFEDLNGKKSAQSLTSNYGKIAEENGAELVAVDGLFQSIELIKQGRADVTTNDRLAVLDYIKKEGAEDIKIVAQADEVTEIALAFNKGNEELVEAVNEQLEAMKEDGTLTKIAEEWFGEDVSTK